MKTQSPNTFHVNTKANAQAVRQYRPNLPADTPVQMKQFARQTLDLVNNIKDTQTPTSVFVTGNQTGDPIRVPLVIGLDAGTSLGMQLKFNRAGKWLVSCNVNLEIIGDSGQIFTISLLTSQSISAVHTASIKPAADQIQMVHQSWEITIGDSGQCTLYIRKSGGGGTSQVLPANTTFTATWQGA